MGQIRLNEVERFVHIPVEVSIQGSGEEDKSPFVKKQIKKIEQCPDQTHLRVYFDRVYFFAVPLDSQVVKASENEWTAFDKNADLYFMIRKVDSDE